MMEKDEEKGRDEGELYRGEGGGRKRGKSERDYIIIILLYDS